MEGATGPLVASGPAEASTLTVELGHAKDFFLGAQEHVYPLVHGIRLDVEDALLTGPSQ